MFINRRLRLLTLLAPCFLLFSQSHAALVGHWVADDLPTGNVTTWNDRVSSLPATSNGDPAKLASGGVEFDGDDALVVAAANNPAANHNTVTLTIAFVVGSGATRAGIGPDNVSQWWGNAMLVGRELPGGNRGDWGVAINSQQEALAGRGGPDTGLVDSKPLNDGEIHVATGVFDGASGSVSLFVDGAKVGEQPGAGSSNIEAETLNFGVNILGNGDTVYFTGEILEVQIDDAVLSDAAITALQNSLLSGYQGGPTIASFTASPDNIYEGQAASLAWSISDWDDPLSVSIDQGVPAISGDSGSISVSPLTDTAYTFTATDSSGTNTKTASVTVEAGIPVAIAQSVSTSAGAARAITLSGSDPNNHPNPVLAFSVVSGPSGGALSGVPPDLTYAPSGGFSGTDSFTFEVNDGKYASPPATVTITVIAQPAPPTDLRLSTSNIGESVSSGGFIATLSTTDVNVGDTHSYSLVAGAGDADNALFSIVGNQLRAATSFAGLVGNSYSIRLRTLDSGGLSYQEAFVLSVVAASNSIVINEIHYNPPNNPVRQEFIELHNPSASAADLTGWRLSGAVGFLFPDGTAVPAGGYLVIAEHPATLLATLGATALGPFSGSLSSEGETVRLRDANDTVIDAVDYKVGFPWPVDADGNGPSIELINPELDNSLGSSWRSAGLAGGPPPPAVTFLAAADPDWHYRKGQTNNPPNDAGGRAWYEPGYDESADNVTWSSNAQTPIGYGDGDDNTLLSDMSGSYSTVYLRHEFTIPDTTPGDDVPPMITLRLYIDDGCIAYLNGNEVSRQFVSGGVKNYNSFTDQGDHERSWEMVVLSAAQAGLVEGVNTLAIHAINATLGSSDLSVDAEVKTPDPDDIAGDPTPGAQNSSFATNAPPNIRQVNHTPQQPTAADVVVITAKVTDPQGIGSVNLEYQLVAPGAYVPAQLPHPVPNIPTTTDRPDNPAYETGWTLVVMADNGTGGDALAGDDIYSATLPAQPHRSLVRYRITVADGLGLAARVPYSDDPSLNFAYFVYDGVPDYNGHAAAALQSVPVYHIITRGEDYAECLAYDGGDQIGQGTQGRFFYNWNATIVYDGVVYDNIRYRLRGANGRYHQRGKRSMRFRLNDGYYFQARDQSGKKYPQKWRTLTTGKGFDNKATLTYGLNEAVNMYLYNKVGVPAIDTHWVHWRVIDGAAEAPDRWRGDFHGLNFILETYDVRFMEAHGLEKGNLYKLINQTGDWAQQQRYQAAFAPTDGSDHNTIEQNLSGSSSAAYIGAHVKLDKWNRWHAMVEAIRHYDYWPSANKNMVYYFEPDYLPANNNKGKLWILPWDTDASWGPNWNSGHDVVYNALFAAGGGGSDGNSTPELWPEYFNAVREIRDLLWQPDQINPVIDEFAGFITPLEAADADRWKGAPADTGNYGGLGGAGASSLGNLAQDMKNFAFSGWSGGSGPTVGAGGRAAFLDSLQASNGEGGQIPNTPTISYTGGAGFPTNGLSFQSSSFSDPQGNGSFGAMQWRIAQITDPAAPKHDPSARFKLEIEAAWESGELAAFDGAIAIPTAAVRSGLTYRARVRHQDTSGRWSHWSAPLEFTTTLPDISDYLAGLVVTEVMYHASDPSAAEITAGFDDDDCFEYIELKNVGATTLDLKDLRFTKGVDFDFLGAAITTLAPGEFVLVVNNLAAFEMRYGPGLPVAGAWQSTDKLDNGGEQVKLSFGAGDAIRDFTYDDLAPWPTSPDGNGPSLTLRNPDAVPDHALAASWVPSSSNGTPGRDDSGTSYATWRDAIFGPGNPPGSGELDDPDFDGVVNLIEYGAGTDALDPASAPATRVGVLASGADEFPPITFPRRSDRADLTYLVEVTSDLTNWDSGAAFTAQVGAPLNHGDGSETLTFQSLAPITSASRQYLRVLVAKQ